MRCSVESPTRASGSGGTLVHELDETVDTAVAEPGPRLVSSGARSGVLLGAASLTGVVFTYAYLLAAGRTLGASDYGALAALVGLLTVVLLPAGAVQFAVAREVSRLIASGEEREASTFVYAALRLAALVTVPLVVVGLVLAVPMASVLGISTGLVLLTGLGLTAAFVSPVGSGTIQGYQRFVALAAMYVLPFALRLVLFAVAVAAGLRLGGAVLATVVSALGAAGFALGLVADPIRRGKRAVAPSLRPFLRYLGPVMVGLIGIAVLTNVDLLVVKARFPGASTGDYAAAAAFARVAFFLPATILSVLFPRTAARQARGEDTQDILGRSLLVTGAFCGALAVFYAMAGKGILVLTYGREYAEGGSLTASYAVAIGLYSLANILVGYHLSRGETRYAWIVAAFAPVQVVALILVPLDLQDLVWANVGVATALLAAHELFVESSVPALGSGLRRLRASVDVHARSVVREGALVLLGVTVFVCVLFRPLVLHLGSTVVGPGSDAVGGMWDFWRMQHEGGFHVFGVTHHTLTGAPFGWSEGNGLYLQALLVYYPAYLVTKIVGEVAAYNLVLLSGYVLSGAAMYLLTRYLGCRRLVSAWAAMVYIVFPWHLVRTPHASLVHLELLPLLIVALVAASRSPTLPRFGFVGLVTLGCWLTAGYIGAMAFVAVIAFTVAAGLTMPWRRGARVAAGSIGSALVASLFVAFLSVLSGVGRGAGLHRVAGDLHTYGVRGIELIVPAAQSLVFGQWLRPFLATRIHGSDVTETSNYLGLLTIVLAVAWLVVARRRRSALGTNLRTATAGTLAVAVAALLLALPSPVHLFGVAVTMPSKLVWDVVPAIRVPSRWVALAMTGLVPLAALGLQWTAERLVRRSGRESAAVVVVVAAMVFSFLELAIDPASPRFRTSVPPEYAAVRSTPPGIVAEYPLGQDPDQLFWQRVHGRSMLGGVPAGTPGQADEARLSLGDPAVPGVGEQLALLGVTALVVHPDAFGKGAPSVAGRSFGPAYALVAREPDGTSVWRVVANPAPALVSLSGGFSDPTTPATPGGTVGYAFTSPAGVGTIGLTARAPEVVRLSLVATPPAGKQQVLRLADDKTQVEYPLDGRSSVSVTVAVPRGQSYVLVKTDPAATSAQDAIVLAAPRASRTGAAPRLHAILVSADPGF